MTCPNGCGMPLRLDTTFEQDAAHYGVPRRRWFCVVGHTVWEPVERVSTMTERPVEPLVPSSAKCTVCRRQLRQDSPRMTHRGCLKRLQRRQLRERLIAAKAALAQRPCQNCRASFQPTTFRNVFCEACRAMAHCRLCGGRHWAGGRHITQEPTVWKRHGGPSHRRKIRAAYKEGHA